MAVGVAPLLSDICVRGCPMTAHPFDCSCCCCPHYVPWRFADPTASTIYQSALRAFSITIDILAIVLPAILRTFPFR